ncbi:hypothetical protein J6590_017669 [Homalodisca vitripennis]|nr:hypothetical protein J6590_017669 [Homalodisca vitripennis]
MPVEALTDQVHPRYFPLTRDFLTGYRSRAYQRTRGTAVQIARIAAGTVIAVTFILGFFMLASAYITASASCANYNFQEALRQSAVEPHREIASRNYQRLRRHLLAKPQTISTHD